MIDEMNTPGAMYEELTDLLSNYFTGHNVTMVKDPWSQIMEGFLVKVHVCGWSGRVQLAAEDFGIPAATYKELTRTLHWGHLNLVDETTRLRLQTIATQVRMLPRNWGRTLHWGMYVPLTALNKFKEEYDELVRDWNEVLQAWIASYDEQRADAVIAIRRFAQQTVINAEKYGTQLDVEAMVERLMRQYPAKEDIQKRFSITYETSFIPTPMLVQEQAAQLEAIELDRQERLKERRRLAELHDYENELERLRIIKEISLEELKVKEKLEIVRAEKEKTTKEMEVQRKKLLSEFYRGYALEIRQRLHEALMYLTEGVRKGKLAPGAGRSLRRVLDEIQYLALEDDAEIQRMRTHLQQILGDPSSRNAIKDARQEIEDFGIVLQTEILILGEKPRMPRRGGEEITAQDILTELSQEPEAFFKEVSAASRRLGGEKSLAETLMEEGDLTRFDLVERRVRRDARDAFE